MRKRRRGENRKHSSKHLQPVDRLPSSSSSSSSSYQTPKEEARRKIKEGRKPRAEKSEILSLSLSLPPQRRKGNF
jgi:hypothetical protein